MVQESKLNVGILGGGPAGCFAAYFLKDFCNVTLIDFSNLMRTILPTGGGRCNLAYSEFDFRELAKNYPRGEKFLYSVFSRYSTAETIETFEKLGVKTYIQEDYRIFPESNSSKTIQDALVKSINGVNVKREKGLRIELKDDKIKLITDMNSYLFDKLVIAIGGHSNFEIVERIGVNIIPPVPSLVGLVTSQNLKSLAGISLNNVSCNGYSGDLLFTHKGVSGPLVYKISSLKARDSKPYSLLFDLYPNEFDLQQLLNNNPHKQIHNLLSDILPKKLANYILSISGVDSEIKCHMINGVQRDKILSSIHEFKVDVIGCNRDGEVVTAGGVDLIEVNSKTMESKKIKGLYFIGEVLDIDGFCGGFNLQNCWSTAYVASNAILNSNID